MDPGRLKRELVEYAVIAAYLYVCFGTLLVYKSAVLRDVGIGYLPHGLAAIKALVLGKFVLIGEGVGVGSRARGPTRFHEIAWKVLAFWLMLILLSGLEEGAKAAFHREAFWPAVAAFFLHPSAEALAGSLVVVLVLIPYVVASSDGRHREVG